MAAHEFTGLPAHEYGRRPVAQQLVDRRREGTDIALGDESRRDSIGRDGGDPARRCGDERGPGCHDLHHRVRKAVDVSGVIVHRWGNRDIGGGQQRRHDIVRDNAEKLHDVAHAGSVRPGSERCLEIAITRDCDTRLRVPRFQHGSRVDEMFESLFLDEPADGKNQRYIICDGEKFTAARPQIRIRLETLAVDAVGDDIRSSRVSA